MRAIISLPKLVSPLGPVYLGSFSSTCELAQEGELFQVSVI